MKYTILSMIAAAGLAAAPAAQAQGYSPFEIGASGGIAFPTGDLSNGANTGYNIALAVGYRPQYSGLAVRGEAAYNQFGLEGTDGSINIPAFTGNVEYALPLGMSFTPYVIGGAGLYRPSADIGGTTGEAENHFGWNVGGGIKVPLSTSFQTFIEARYNSVNVNGGTLSFVPVTVGVMF
ncbi:MAG TPA: outer membrane beta-barrel protein [Gemmatimonadaceae bacterium]|nr:outer membrane beta-barrel protein [Gemmatimonadaceae bacterium]